MCGVRPHAEDQPQLRPRPLVEGVVGGPGRLRHQGRRGRRQDERQRHRRHRPRGQRRATCSTPTCRRVGLDRDEELLPERAADPDRRPEGRARSRKCWRRFAVYGSNHCSAESGRIGGPADFSSGPDSKVRQWQMNAIELIRTLSPDIHIANPRRDYLPGEFVYAAQVNWESHYLRHASADGVILFWLAREAVHQCDRAYAQTSRFELAEWKVRHERDGAHSWLELRKVSRVRDIFDIACRRIARQSQSRRP